MVLIVEDDESLIEVYHLCLEEFVRLIVARTVKEAEQVFSEYEFAAVVVDGHVKGPEPITVRLVRQMRYARPGLKIIANSSDDQLQGLLLEAGCSESCRKHALPERLQSLLAA